MTDKQNFEKDINVPSNAFLNNYSCDAKDCEQYCSDNTCCTCRNREWYRLYKVYKAKEQKCERLKEEKAEILKKTGMIETLQGYTVKDIEYMQQQLDQLKAENERLRQAFAESDNDCFRLEKENRLLKVYRSITPLKVKKLVQTLDEIKEITEKAITTIKYAERECYGDAEWSELRGKCTLARQILNKINDIDDESYLDNHWLFTKEKGDD